MLHAKRTSHKVSFLVVIGLRHIDIASLQQKQCGENAAQASVAFLKRKGLSPCIPFVVWRFLTTYPDSDPVF